MPYPYAEVTNSTGHDVSGEVKYAGCTTDDYTVKPGKTWRATSRGLCLLTVVEANVHTPDGVVRAKPYTSSGTSYSQFLVARMGDGYIVTRVVNDVADEEAPMIAEETA